MDSSFPEMIDDEAPVRQWERRAPWYRRISGKTGLQGKLVLSFMFLLTLTMGSALWLFLAEGHAGLDRVMSQQALAVAQALGMASEAPLARRDTADLNRIGRDLLRTSELIAVAFYGPKGEMLALSTRQADMDAVRADLLPNPRDQMGELLIAHKRQSAALGAYTQVTAPVTTARHWPESGRPVGARLVGYVSLCFSRAADEEQLNRVGHLFVLIAGISALVSLPLVYGLVRRIFHPIRQLVDATDRIAGGDLGAQVAVNRPDVIGTLARSFNEMVKTIRRQQFELGEANAQLAEANVRLGEANKQLEHANQALEQKVADRTGQLETANKRLREEVAEKEDFLRAVSHDLNAPLRNIAGMASMLLLKHKDSFQEDVISRLERIRKNVEVETDLIAELLELSRIKTRRLKLEPVDMDVLVRQVAEVFEHELRGRDIRFVVDGPLPAVNCERARLRQVFQNLFDNAIKYMGNGCAAPVTAGGAAAFVKEIHVGCVVRPDEAEFYVRDTGMGIDPEDLDKVFYVFRRGKGAAMQNVPGKGVGLASVKSIVETYNGSIRVESVPGEGSTFRFTINGQHVLAKPVKSAGPGGQGRAA